jgi:hypothetical protein
MTKDPGSPDDAAPLSEETAHRVLARAVELDVRHASEVPLARLREIAREAGIGDRAFELALREIGETMPVRANEERGATGAIQKLRRFAPVLRNAGAFAAAMGIIGVANRLISIAGTGWPLEHAVAILANVVGVGLSLRVRAKLAAFVLAVTAIAQLAEYPMHLVFGITTVQGGATKWALILAAALGLGFGMASRKVAAGRLAKSQNVESEPNEGVATESAAGGHQLRSLSLRTT